MDEHSETPAPNDPDAKNDKKPYIKPTLTTHGPVRELTQTIGLTATDGLTGSTI